MNKITKLFAGFASMATLGSTVAVLASCQKAGVEFEVTIEGAEFNKDKSNLALDKDSTIAFTLKAGYYVNAVTSIKVGETTLTESDYTLNKQESKIVIKDTAMKSNKIAIVLSTAQAKLTISGTDKILAANSTLYAVIVDPKEMSNEVTWSVENKEGTGEAYASIDQKGNLTAFSKGDVIVKATSKLDSSIFATKEVSIITATEAEFATKLDTCYVNFMYTIDAYNEVNITTPTSNDNPTFKGVEYTSTSIRYVSESEAEVTLKNNTASQVITAGGWSSTEILAHIHDEFSDTTKYNVQLSYTDNNIGYYVEDKNTHEYEKVVFNNELYITKFISTFTDSTTHYYAKTNISFAYNNRVDTIEQPAFETLFNKYLSNYNNVAGAYTLAKLAANSKYKGESCTTATVGYNYSRAMDLARFNTTTTFDPVVIGGQKDLIDYINSFPSDNYDKAFKKSSNTITFTITSKANSNQSETRVYDNCLFLKSWKCTITASTFNGTDLTISEYGPTFKDFATAYNDGLTKYTHTYQKVILDPTSKFLGDACNEECPITYDAAPSYSGYANIGPSTKYPVGGIPLLTLINMAIGTFDYANLYFRVEEDYIAVKITNREDTDQYLYHVFDRKGYINHAYSSGDEKHVTNIKVVRYE